MRLHTSLTREQVVSCLPEGVAAHVTPKASRKRERAFEITLYVFEKDELHRRFGNSGGYGASDEVAATWDEWGIWMDRLYSLDPQAIVGYYADYETFISETTRYHDYVRRNNKPESIAYRTHTAPWLDKPASEWAYFTCESCGHVECRASDLEAVSRCENCGATCIVAFDDLDKAEDWSQLVLDGDLVPTD